MIPKCHRTLVKAALMKSSFLLQIIHTGIRRAFRIQIVTSFKNGYQVGPSIPSLCSSQQAVTDCLGTGGGVKKPPMPTFSPKDQHCGIWQSPPNKTCHASFGDGGTTASTNCYGDIIQMTQYLGVGRSGFFSMDQESTDEPYFVCSRASDLQELVKDTGRLLSYDLILPDEIFPQEPLNVKWVNWRWPRYEYNTDVTGTKSSAQWIVHNGVVLKQLVLENATKEKLESRFIVTKDMLIRDLDYLDSSYHFNDSGEGYSYVPGPNGFGYVCVHTLEPQVKADIPNENRTPQDVLTSSRRSNTGYMNRRASEGPGSTPAAQNVDPLMIAQPKSPMLAEQAEGKDENRRETAPHKISSQAAASIITVFVNGKAIMTQGTGGLHTFTLAGKDSESTEPYGTKLELVVAYKMILLPSGPIDWRNFLVPAQEADVNTILREETENLWGSSDNFQPSSLGISLMNGDPEGQDQGSKTFNTQNSSNSPVQQTMQDFRDGNVNTDFGPSKEHATTTVDDRKSQGTQKTKIPPVVTTGMAEHPIGTPNKTSSKTHIEYLMWRHLEHILSVCAVPLSTPALYENASGMIPNSDGCSKSEGDTPVALTCGDMAGHRICTSASL